uniref:Uncharacterized protein n=1 Tax=Cyanoptyche gloeocystis TaxID=77922 RepID=A0A7S2JKY7_9EUKA|mmetsp:Transcript_1028/g.1954  ORF Transcript_1028/g.1954 Transcript_1028/m.1954 type:complete len:118 (+) Transcript_1028:166-519(+)
MHACMNSLSLMHRFRLGTAAVSRIRSTRPPARFCSSVPTTGPTTPGVKEEEQDIRAYAHGEIAAEKAEEVLRAEPFQPASDPTHMAEEKDTIHSMAARQDEERPFPDVEEAAKKSRN